MELQPDALTGCHTTTSGDIHVCGVNGNQQIGTLLGTPGSLIYSCIYVNSNTD